MKNLKAKLAAAKAKVDAVKATKRAEPKKAKGRKTSSDARAQVLKLAQRKEGVTRQELLKLYPDSKNVTPKLLVASVAKGAGLKMKQFEREGRTHYAAV